MKKRYVYWCVAAIVLGAGLLFWRARAGRSSRSPVETREVKAVRGDIEKTVEAAGEVAPLNRVEIKPSVAGRVEEVLVEEGRSVRPGQTLAWMSSQDRAAILDAARAEGPDAVRRWEQAYRPTPVKAPLGGVLILRSVVVGQTVDTGTTLFALSDKLIILAQVDEVDIGKVRLGQTARITLDADPATPFTGTVFAVLQEGKNVSNVITYDVKIAPDKAPPIFRSQMTANVSFLLDRRRGVVVVPAAAVRAGSDGVKKVSLKGTDGKPRDAEVETGLENDEHVEIVAGVAEGDTLLIRRPRYIPQQAAASSPLVMGGRSGGGSGGGGRGNGR
jgi:macrolide-specific efflux system membrane fusion protein